MNHVFGFVEFYVAPFIFAFGIFLFVYGIINYFIIGPGFEEGRRETGRQQLLWATFFFLVGFIVFGISHGLLNVQQAFEADSDVDGNITESEDILRVPNVPGVE